MPAAAVMVSVGYENAACVPPERTSKLEPPLIVAVAVATLTPVPVKPSELGRRVTATPLGTTLVVEPNEVGVNTSPGSQATYFPSVVVVTVIEVGVAYGNKFVTTKENTLKV
jgi:hypothetical protein